MGASNPFILLKDPRIRVGLSAADVRLRIECCKESR